MDVGGSDREGGRKGEGCVGDNVDGGSGLGESVGSSVVASEVEGDRQGRKGEGVAGAKGDPPLSIVYIKTHLLVADLLINPELTGRSLSGIVLVVNCNKGEGGVGEGHSHRQRTASQRHAEGCRENDSDGEGSDLDGVLAESAVKSRYGCFFFGQVEGVGGGNHVLPCANDDCGEGISQIEEGGVAVEAELRGGEADLHVGEEGRVVGRGDTDGV